jgi:RNA polymerase sigma factor, sigma-70 family
MNKNIDDLMEKYKFLVKRQAKAMYLLGGEKEDLLQEGMIGLFKAIQSYDDTQEVPLERYAQLCITRQMYSAIKAASRQKHMPLNSYVSIYDTQENEQENTTALIDMLGSDGGNPELMFLGKEYEKMLGEHLKSKLSQLEEQVLHLHLAGIDYKSIANSLDKTPKAIDNALQRIKGKVQEIIRSEDWL